jgi:hypothetical protein
VLSGFDAFADDRLPLITDAAAAGTSKARNTLATDLLVSTRFSLLLVHISIPPDFVLSQVKVWYPATPSWKAKRQIRALIKVTLSLDGATIPLQNGVNFFS